jgi:NAD(P)-dependent dehydrogenase (short-subunit alcohol dehydrogenase family)
VNISSTNALRPRPTNTIYCISKSTVNSVTENLAMEYAKYNIRVNAIAPGLIGVGMSQKVNTTPAGRELLEKRFPMGCLGGVESLDGPLLLLCSEASRYITGDCLYVDGGFSTKAIM